MTQLAFGFTMLVVGMGGTLLTLWLLTLLIRGLVALLPARNGAGDEKKN